jgi:hypothetical protein
MDRKGMGMDKWLASYLVAGAMGHWMVLIGIFA